MLRAHRVGVEGLQDDGGAGAVGVGGADAEGVALLQAAVDEGEVLGGRLVRRRALAHARAEERVRTRPQEYLQCAQQIFLSVMALCYCMCKAADCTPTTRCPSELFFLPVRVNCPHRQSARQNGALAASVLHELQHIGRL